MTLAHPPLSPAEPPPAALAEAQAAVAAGQWQAALVAVAGLMQQWPASAGVQGLAGLVLIELGDAAAAEPLLRLATAGASGERRHWNNLAVALERQGRLADAAAIHAETLRRWPDYAPAAFNLACVTLAMGDADGARQQLHATLAIDPAHADAWYNLANLRRDAGDAPGAIAAYEAALAHAPGHWRARYNLACLFIARRQPAPALAALDALLALAPHHPRALHALGEARLLAGDASGAAAAFGAAFAADPALAQAAANQGRALMICGDAPGALAAFTAALALGADDNLAREALYLRRVLADWGANADFAALPVTSPGPQPASPFLALPFEDAPERALARARAYAAATFLPARPLAPPPPAPRIRIGYLSGDFHEHATMYLLAGVLRHHDPRRFAIRAYSHGRPDEGPMRQLVRAHCERFVEIGQLDDAAAAELLRAEELDILVDLKGFTQGSRVGLLGARCAPVQASWLGYPGTLGHPAIDYAIADATLIPPAQRAHYDERLCLLPHCYQPNDNQRPILPDTLGRAGHGLPAEGLVLACFNQIYKIGPAEWAIWMELLRSVPGSVLWLLAGAPQAHARLAQAAREAGVDPARLVFAPPIAHHAHLGRMALADLFLDCFAVGAHTTAADALWAGLPVLTMAGRGFAARVCASVVRAGGLGQLVTDSPASYRDLALALARDPAALAALRQQWGASRHAAPLFDTAGFTRQLEAGFAAMHQRRLAGLPPADISVAADPASPAAGGLAPG